MTDYSGCGYMVCDTGLIAMIPGNRSMARGVMIFPVLSESQKYEWFKVSCFNQDSTLSIRVEASSSILRNISSMIGESKLTVYRLLSQGLMEMPTLHSLQYLFSLWGGNSEEAKAARYVSGCGIALVRSISTCTVCLYANTFYSCSTKCRQRSSARIANVLATHAIGAA